jgi:hypothetical protein
VRWIVVVVAVEAAATSLIKASAALGELYMVRLDNARRCGGARSAASLRPPAADVDAKKETISDQSPTLPKKTCLRHGTWLAFVPY